MHHVHRHVNALQTFKPLLVAQKARGIWGGIQPVLVKKSPFREIGRLIEKQTHRPWQISQGEARRMESIFRSGPCRLVHLFFGDSAIHLLPFLRRSRCPVLVSFHGSDVAGAFASDDFRMAREQLFAIVALVACRSEDLSHRVASLGCPRHKLRVMRAVLPEFPKAVPRMAPAAGAWRILQAGRMVPKKGMATALAAFARFLAVYPNARLTIAGEGPLRTALEAEARKLDIAGAVRFPGFFTQEELAREFVSSHFYLHPSETVSGDREGVPNSLLEAMASGLPVVSTRHGGIQEVIQHGSTGLLCPEGDAEALAKALLSLADSAADYSRISLAGMSFVRQEFSTSRQVESIESLYREAVQLGLDR